MKTFKRILFGILVSVSVFACQEEEPTLDTILVPTNLVVSAIVEGDQSGNISVTPSADNALNFHVIFTPGADPVVINAGQTASFRFTRSGQYSAPITVVAFGKGGVSSSVTEIIDLDVRLFLDDATKQLIAGDGTKRWVWDSSEAGHFGVGPLTNNFPEFFSAGPNALNPCVYDDVLVFSYDDQDNYTYQLEPGADNLTFINWTDVNRFFPDPTPQPTANPSMASVISKYTVMPFIAPEITALSKPNKKPPKATIKLIKTVYDLFILITSFEISIICWFYDLKKKQLY